MANFFPCPNPACTYQFDADQLPEAAMVTCPICRTRFPYRAAAAAPDVSEPSETRSNPRVNRLVNPRSLPKGNRTQTTVMLIGFTLVLVGLIAGITYSLNRRWFKERDANEPFTDEMFNFRWKVPEDPWSRDDTLKRDLGFNAFVYSKQKPDAEVEAAIGLRCVMLGGSDGVRGPRQGELEAEVRTVLGKFENVQKNPIQSTLAKQSVNGYQFDATLKNSAIWGEIYWSHNKGIGYIMAVWALKDKWDVNQKELAALRDTFEFAGLRSKWRETADATVRHSVENGDYQVEDGFAVWERADPNGGPKSYVRDPTDADEKATMLFRCKYPEKKRRNDLRPEADAMVLVFAGGGENPQDVANYLQKKLADYKFEPLEKQPANAPIPKSTASIGTFLATNATEARQNRYYAIATLKIGSNNVAVVGWCKYGDAEAMSEYILGLVASLKAK